MITREDIIGKKRPTPVKAVTIPGWGELFVRKLGASEGLLAQSLMDSRKTSFDWPGRIAVLMASDAAGNRLFKDADAAELNNDAALKDSLEAFITAGMEFNAAITPAAHEEAKKNSEPTSPV